MTSGGVVHAPASEPSTCAPGALVHRCQQLLEPRELPPREHRNRRPGARQERPEHVGILERQHFAQQRHERRARRLMPAIPHRLAQPRRSPDLQRMHQRQHALQVEDRVLRAAACPAAPRAPSPSRDPPPASPPPAADRRATSSAARPDRAPLARGPRSARRTAPAPRCRRAPRASVAAPAARRRAAARSPARRPAGPATVAAALLPSPAAIGMSLSTSTTTVGALVPGRCASRSNARSSAFSPVTGGVLSRTTSLVPPSSRTSIDRGRAGRAEPPRQACRIRRRGWRRSRERRFLRPEPTSGLSQLTCHAGP